MKYSNNLSNIKYDDKYIPLESSEYFNCISFVCYMYDIPASYSVKNFDKYTQFKELKNITDVSQLQIGDVITWEYESGAVDGNGNPIYEYHASIWKGNGKIWECMDPNGVRYKEYSSYYSSMIALNKPIHVVKYFRYKDGQNAKS